MKSTIYLICGMPGSGASDYAIQFGKRNKFPVVSLLDAYEKVNGDAHNHANSYEVLREMWDKIRYYEKTNQTVVVDYPALTQFDRSLLLALFPSFKIKHIIWVDCPVSLCRKNTKAYTTLELLRARANKEPVRPNEDMSWDSVTIWKNENNELALRGVFIRPSLTEEDGLPVKA